MVPRSSAVIPARAAAGRGLRDLRPGIAIGCHPDFIPEGPGFVHPSLPVLLREFDIVVFNRFHWNALRPDREAPFAWDPADAAVAFAERHGLRLRGHALLWYQMLPSWVEREEAPARLETAIRDHVAAVVGRYRGRIASWDVVNEPLHLPDGRADGLREDPLTRRLGERWIDAAFEAAREADPDAELVLNEALLSHADQAPQRRAFRDLTARLVGRGAPIDGIGIQSHLFWDDLQPMGLLDPEGTAALVRELGRMQLSAHLTELDVFDATLPRDPAQRDAAVAAAYSEYLVPLLACPELRSVVFWGMADPNSWYNTYVRRVLAERLPADHCARPLLFDEHYAPKPAYSAVAGALRAATIDAVALPRSTP